MVKCHQHSHFSVDPEFYNTNKSSRIGFLVGYSGYMNNSLPIGFKAQQEGVKVWYGEVIGWNREAISMVF